MRVVAVDVGAPTTLVGCLPLADRQQPGFGLGGPRRRRRHQPRHP